MPDAVPPPPPPVVAVSPGDASGLFGKFPKFMVDGQPHILLQFTLRADRKLLETAKAKLAAESWPSEFQRDRSGGEDLAIGLENRSWADSVDLGRRLQNGDFGNVEVDTMSLPDPMAR